MPEVGAPPPAELVSEVVPGDLEGFLGEHGWHSIARREGLLALWQREDLPETAPGSRLNVPLDTSLHDYYELIHEAIVSAALALNEAPRTLVQRILLTSADVVRIRADAETGADGTIPLERGVELVSGARNLLVASAAATERKRSYFGRAKTRRAARVGDKVRLGQTERGSYVITVVLRTPRMDDDQANNELDVQVPQYSFERRALTTMARALTATRNAVDEHRERRQRQFAPFMERIADGVSADFCDALATLVEGEGTREVSIHFEWSRALPVDAERRDVEFSHDEAGVLRAASARLRPSDEYTGYTIEGPVEGLRRAEGDEEGVVTIRGRVADKIRPIRVPLTGHDYVAAVSAHGSRDSMRITGDLTQEGRIYYLVNARTVQLLRQGRLSTKQP